MFKFKYKWLCLLLTIFLFTGCNALKESPQKPTQTDYSNKISIEVNNLRRVELSDASEFIYAVCEDGNGKHVETVRFNPETLYWEWCDGTEDEYETEDEFTSLCFRNPENLFTSEPDYSFLSLEESETPPDVSSSKTPECKGTISLQEKEYYVYVWEANERPENSHFIH